MVKGLEKLEKIASCNGIFRKKKSKFRVLRGEKTPMAMKNH